MSQRRALAFAAGSALAAACTFGACADPTQISVSITTDEPCANGLSTSVSGGHGDPAVTTQCSQNGAFAEIGSMVFVPSRAKNDPVTITVVMGVGKPATDCDPAVPDPACIVARRKMRFIPRTPLPITVQMRAACLGKPCTADQTCVLGQCIAAATDSPQFHDEGDAGSTLDAGPAGDAGDAGTDAPLADVVVDAPVDVDAGSIVPCQAAVWPAGASAFRMALTSGHLVWTSAAGQGELHYSARDVPVVTTTFSGVTGSTLVGAYEDSTGLHAFWTTGTGAGSSLYFGTPTSPAFYSSSYITALSVDATGAAGVSLYTANAVQLYDKGVPVSPPATVASPEALAVNGTTEYFVASGADNALHHVTGTNSTDIYGSTTGPILQVALAPGSNGIYWVESSPPNGLLFHGSRDGSTPKSQLATMYTTSSLAVNGKHVFWTESGVIGPRAAGLYQLDVGTVGPPTQVRSLTNAGPVVADESCVYVSDNAGIYQVPP